MIEKALKTYTKLLGAWDSVLRMGLKLPFSRVDKERYLRRVFKSKVKSEEVMRLLIAEKPSVLFSEKVIEEMTSKEIRKHALCVTILSILCALPPDGWLMWLLIAVDFIQFQIFVFIILQKMLYLYGCRDLFEREEGNEEKSMTMMLLIISVVMIGKHQVVRLAKSAMGMAVKQVIQRFAVRLMTRMVVLNLLRQLAKWFGIVLTKEMVVASLAVIIPLICAVISGLISLWLFMPMVKRLHSHLQELSREGKDPVEIVMEQTGGEDALNASELSES